MVHLLRHVCSACLEQAIENAQLPDLQDVFNMQLALSAARASLRSSYDDAGRSDCVGVFFAAFKATDV